MAAGRTYATYDKNLRLLYYVNNHVMGSEIRTSADELTFEIEASDPDTSDASDRIVLRKRSPHTGSTGKCGCPAGRNITI